MQFHHDVDVVFTWIQPDDKQCALERTMHEILLFQRKPTSKRRLPYQSINHEDTELYHAIQLVLRNMPWVRYIYIVVHDGQEFKCKNIDFRIKIVHHSKIFPNPLIELPTFNSHAIESCLHRIPGIAENFIYFNDDIYTMRPIASPFSFFFYKKRDGTTAVPCFLQDGFTRRSYLKEKLPTKFADHYICCVHNHQILDNTYGFKTVRPKPWHQPLALSKTILQQAESLFPQYWQSTRECRFRSLNNIVPLYFALELALHLGQIPLLNIASKISIWRSCPRNLYDWRRIQRVIQSQQSIVFACVNDMSDDTPVNIRQLIFDFLKSNF
jgi:hypothetical protein